MDGRAVRSRTHCRRERLRFAPFNALVAVRAALALGDVAAVLTEIVLTNIGVIMPDPCSLDALRTLAREVGTLLILDETHTHLCGPGGLTRVRNLPPDIVTVGKAIAGRVPLGASGM